MPSFTKIKYQHTALPAVVAESILAGSRIRNFGAVRIAEFDLMSRDARAIIQEIDRTSYPLQSTDGIVEIDGAWRLFEEVASC